MRLISAFAAALIASSNFAYASELPANYVEKPLSDSEVRKYWADSIQIAKPIGQYSPWVLISRLAFGEGREIVVTQLWAGGACSAKACPLRVYEGDEMIANAMACDQPERHLISADARTVVACTQAIRTNRR